MMEIEDCVKKIVEVVLFNCCYVFILIWYLFNVLFCVFVFELFEIFFCMFFFGKFLFKSVKMVFELLFGEEISC